MADVPLADDELELALRPAPDIAGRLLVLSALLDRLALEASADGVSEVQAAAFDLREWLKAEAILPLLTPREQGVLESPVGALAEQCVAAADLVMEALTCLAWSLGLSRLPAFGTSADVAALVPALPHPWDTTQAWLASQAVRSLEDIATAREAAEVWEWRLSAELTRTYMSAVELAELELAIRETEADATAHGVIVPGKSGEFSIGEKAISRIPPDELDEFRELAAARLQALNWLCGYGEDWDSVPLEI